MQRQKKKNEGGGGNKSERRFATRARVETIAEGRYAFRPRFQFSKWARQSVVIRNRSGNCALRLTISSLKSHPSVVIVFTWGHCTASRLRNPRRVSSRRTGRKSSQVPRPPRNNPRYKGNTCCRISHIRRRLCAWTALARTPDDRSSPRSCSPAILSVFFSLRSNLITTTSSDRSRLFKRNRKPVRHGFQAEFTIFVSHKELPRESLRISVTITRHRMSKC